jgi:hypothetical protein
LRIWQYCVHSKNVQDHMDSTTDQSLFHGSDILSARNLKCRCFIRIFKQINVKREQQWLMTKL